MGDVLKVSSTFCRPVFCSVEIRTQSLQSEDDGQRPVAIAGLTGKFTASAQDVARQ